MTADLAVGPALDAEVAFRVFNIGCHDGTCYDLETGNAVWAHCPPFSTDLASAWSVVEHMAAHGWDWHVSRLATFGAEGHFWRPGAERIYSEDASTVPEAICRAALAALEAR